MGVVESRKFVAKSFKIFNNTEVPAAFQVNLSQVISFFFFSMSRTNRLPFLNGLLLDLLLLLYFPYMS